MFSIIFGPPQTTIIILVQMSQEWQEYLFKKKGAPAARHAFEKDCRRILASKYPDKRVQEVKVSRGDGGIDIFIGEPGVEPIIVYQCKFFIEGFGNSQKQQIQNSFTRVMTNQKIIVKQWFLCLPREFTKDEHIWWSGWKEKQRQQYGLGKDFIKLKEGNDLIDIIKDVGLYDEIFEKETNILLKEIHHRVHASEPVPDTDDIRLEQAMELANVDFEYLRKTFGDHKDAHLKRSQEQEILDWINGDPERSQRNLFILDGEKGMGKSLVLRNIWSHLKKEGQAVLGIKADRYYASGLQELEQKIFDSNEVSFKKLAQYLANRDQELVILLDQLDAMSLSLSSKRAYLHTYNKLIRSLTKLTNVKVIISVRSVDLENDADLRVYKEANIKRLTLARLSTKEVANILYTYEIYQPSNQLLELLCTPNHLDIFCKLPNKKKVHADTLTTLSDLYQVLWKQLINSKPQLELKKVLYHIASRMYEEQRITIAFTVENYQTELDYLISNNLLSLNRGEVQFFHQTFYDYVFARSFVEEGKSLENYLKENGQGLYVRSIVKMILDYQREFNNEEYNRLIEMFLSNHSYRFHLKMMILQTLGMRETPTIKEQELFENHIIGNNHYESVFLHGVFSKGWLSYLTKSDYPARYLAKKSEVPFRWKSLFSKIWPWWTTKQHTEDLERQERLDAIYRLFFNNIQQEQVVFSYINSLKASEAKTRLVQSLLKHVKQWDQDLALQLFDRYARYDTAHSYNNFWYYTLLGNMFSVRTTYVLDQLRPLILERFKEKAGFNLRFEYEEEQLFKKMYRQAPDTTFRFFLDIMTDLVQEHHNTYSVAGNRQTVLVQSYLFRQPWSLDGSQEAGYFIAELLAKHVQNMAKTDVCWFRTFKTSYGDSNSIHHLKLLVSGFSQSPNFYTTELLEFLHTFDHKNGFKGCDDELHYEIRMLLKTVFKKLSHKQQEQVCQLILRMQHPMEMYREEERVDLSENGLKKYVFLAALPEEPLKAHKTAWQTYRSLFRKFGKRSLEQINKSTARTYSINSPIGMERLRLLSYDDLLGAFRKYNSTYKRKAMHGGKDQLVTSFGSLVKEAPKKYYPFIQALLEDASVEAEYKTEALRSLAEGGFDPRLLRELVKRFLNQTPQGRNLLYIIWQLPYIIKAEEMDEELLHQLIGLYRKHQSVETSFHDDYSKMLNDIAPSILNVILLCSRLEHLQTTVKEVLDELGPDSEKVYRMTCVKDIACFNSIGRAYGFQKFQEFVQNGEKELLTLGISAVYHYRESYNKELQEFYRQLRAHPEVHGQVGELLVDNWLEGYSYAKNNLRLFLKAGPEARKSLLQALRMEVLERNGTAQAKCLKLLPKFLKDEDKDLAGIYVSLFHQRRKGVDFLEKLFPFLKIYVKSDKFLQYPKPLLDKLLLHVQDCPELCFQLIRRMDFKKRPDIQAAGYYSNEPVRLILAIYDAFTKREEPDSKKIAQTLDIFEEMLLLDHLHVESGKALETFH
ncbi:NACHT domain-containing protein [Christiangramia sp. SM2212]|uniref:NACHT domain-containing protein n=1 Tax=Christiangramia sediminicola TaxID=3073267 RepID=A0ABU1ETF8_9FLAO|nr:NACHT domain-containing protein [Christiangramia sp. SM2212]MDR5591676.1 NACHT domain-containing protein [Christiangramia sp. SM2212]